MNSKKNRLPMILAICFWGLVTACFCNPGMAEDQTAKSISGEGDLLAVGDGIRVTILDMEEMRTYFESNRIFMKPEKYKIAALEMKLYAMEAKALGLDGSTGVDQTSNDFDKEQALAVLYIEDLIKKYPLDELVIESYYRANPKKFEHWDESSQSYEPKPMNDDIRRSIREIVLAPKKRQIQQDEYKRLLEKYSVRFCDNDKGCSESL